MYQPESTYRLQFHKGFTFDDLEKNIPYLHQLGIKTIYASPIFEAVPGSAHGYDGLNPNVINPEIGTLEQLYKVRERLRNLGMGWLQDFVPNHMAYTPQNEWLCDYLEKGKMSDYDEYFDKNPDEPLMAPFLGGTIDEVLSQNKLKIVYRKEKLQISCFGHFYPLNYSGYAEVFNYETFDGKGFNDLRMAADLLSQTIDKAEFQKQWGHMLMRLAEIMKHEPSKQVLADGLEVINADKLWLRQLLDVQFYRLCKWDETNTRINYRRFFTINSLICINIQNEQVFTTCHRLLFQLIRDDVIQGIRIDHIDGLYDPEGYLKQLRNITGPDVYIVVEKILAHNEQLPHSWPVQGTTGYDFLAQVNNLLTEIAARPVFEEMYFRLTGSKEPAGQQVYLYKKVILDQYMQGELANLLTLFLRAVENRLPDGVSAQDMKLVISEMLICCPVYRYYPRGLPLVAQEAAEFSALITVVRERKWVRPEALEYFQHCLIGIHPAKEPQDRKLLFHFWCRFMQLSGPLMAKGVEDTMMYNNQNFLAHNEVGNSLSVFGMSVEAFHKAMAVRKESFPLTMNATATHDTKRGEDSRARLQLLSSNHKLWLERFNSWISTSEHIANGLSPADRYFAIQVVYAAMSADVSDDSFNGRVKEYMIKAAREAKSKTSWDHPDESYEAVLVKYALYLSDPKSKTGKDMRQFLKQQEQQIAVRSLVQLVLKCTAPGTPDIYQGTELWDNSFVDPDNRRTVDYGDRITRLNALNAPGFALERLLDNLDNADLKLFCMQRLLMLRRQLPELFSLGLYEPLEIAGDYIAFLRRYKEDWLFVVIPFQWDIHQEKAEAIILPMEAPLQWRNIFSDTVLKAADINLTKQLEQFPVLVLKSEPVTHQRSAGVLLPLFSLPTQYGIGDMGPGARNFITFLGKSAQKLWQILPLNPVSQENFFSPYACSSAFAGDPMYIDLEGLKAEGLITEADTLPIELPSSPEVNYVVVRDNKKVVLNKAFENFNAYGSESVKKEFQSFCLQEADWLDDYALFAVIKSEYSGAPWYEWPEVLRNRYEDHLRIFGEARSLQIDFQKWMQFVFFRQWARLKTFARQHNITFVGDIPFYMSNDSVEVWAHRQLFKTDEYGAIMEMAGVPPDYFSASGQLWGMPVYDWSQHEKEDFRWWLKRLKQNIRLYDIVRLDHFRAFYDYWAVPGGAITAINGKWEAGPQDKLLSRIQQRFPEMPFIAEDLGEIHKGVFDFKDKYKLPGMHILQFGFEHYDGRLRDLPHNFEKNSVVYTGTHDNNTTIGWFNGLDIDARKALNHYVGYEVTEGNIVETMVRMAYSSVAAKLIIPVQDLLGLDEKSRINTPSTIERNWQWQMMPGDCDDGISLWLLQQVRSYNR